MCFRVPLYILVALTACGLHASEDRDSGLVVRAQSDFDRVELSGRPQIQETNGCVQSQAAAIAVAPRAELASLYFQKGYCELIGATINHRTGDFQQAAGSFQKSIEAWPDSLERNGKNAAPQPAPSGLRILTAISPLLGDSRSGDPGANAAKQISAAVDHPSCPASLMASSFCQTLLQVGHEWLGWMALQRSDLIEATRELSAVPRSPWARWTAGQQAFRDRNYAEAGAQYQQAVQLWIRAQNAPDIAQRLAPQPDLPLMWMQSGKAQLIAGDAAGAKASLDSAIRGNSLLARAIYYRARAEDLQGRTEEALADYALASRTAFANAQDLKSGEAHLYRGIVFFRRKDYARAEDEFASALNFGMAPDLIPDAEAWRHMAAVAQGACGASRQLLEDSLTRVSALFPKAEARSLAAACPLIDAGPVTGGLP
jgi:tetratricopeptide (TPR) repeat protein